MSELDRSLKETVLGQGIGRRSAPRLLLNASRGEQSALAETERR